MFIFRSQERGGGKSLDKQNYLCVKLKKLRKGFQIGGVVFTGYVWIKIKVLEQKRFVDQEEFLVVEELEVRLKRGKEGEIDEEVEIVVIDCFGSLRKEKE